MANYTTSDYIDPVVPPGQKNRSEFTDKAKGLPVGKAFIVEGMAINTVYTRINQISKVNGIELKATDLKDGRVQVARIA